MRLVSFLIFVAGMCQPSAQAFADTLATPFTARCIDSATGSIFRATVQGGGFAYNFDGGTEFTAIRGGYWTTPPGSTLLGKPNLKSMKAEVLGATFELSDDEGVLSFSLTKLDANKISFINEIAKGGCALIPLIRIPPNLDVGATFKGPRDERLDSL